jgi:putative sugar O-methyltransferase
MNAEQPSGFWEQLGEAHRRDLDLYGFDACKRHQALRYFTWRWSWSSIRKSEQIRFLLRSSPLRTLLRCTATPTALSDRAWEGVTWPKRDRWLYAFATRLLWLYAVRHDVAGTTRLPEPTLGRPLPVKWKGSLISQDLANTSIEVAAVRQALAGTTPRSILEIGAGYDRTAYGLMHPYPRATYTIVDIPPAIEISEWYLSQLFPRERLRFVTPHEAVDIPVGSVDLALSISSLQEMTREQVSDYLRMLDRVAENGTIYLKQWISWKNPVDRIVLTFDEYPIPDRWEPLFRQRAPVQTNFAHAAWKVPGSHD